MATDPHSKLHPMPFTRVELCVLSVVEGQLQVLLARRAGEPFKGRWGLPGGVLRIDLDDSLESAAQRIAQERLNCELPFLRQLEAVGGPSRDRARAPWALSIVYRALVPAESLTPAAGKRVEALEWHPADEASQDARLAFDHAKLIEGALHVTRTEVRALELPRGFIPERFTLGELQSTCEQLLGERLDKSSFRRRLAERELVEAVSGELRTGPNRPAQVYQLRPT